MDFLTPPPELSISILPVIGLVSFQHTCWISNLGSSSGAPSSAAKVSVWAHVICGTRPGLAERMARSL